MTPQELYTRVEDVYRRERAAVVAILVAVLLLPMWGVLADIAPPAIIAGGVLLLLAFFNWARLGSKRVRLYKDHDRFRALAAVPIRPGERFGLQRILTADDEYLHAQSVLGLTGLRILRVLGIVAAGASASLSAYILLRGNSAAVDPGVWLPLILAITLVVSSIVPATVAWAVSTGDGATVVRQISLKWNGRTAEYILDSARIDAVAIDDRNCWLFCDVRGEKDFAVLPLATLDDGKYPWRLDRLADELSRRLNVPRATRPPAKDAKPSV